MEHNENHLDEAVSVTKKRTPLQSYLLKKNLIADRRLLDRLLKFHSTVRFFALKRRRRR